MTDEEQAAYYDAHRDDPDVWEEDEDEIRMPAKPQQLTTTVTVRFAPADAEKLRQLAERLGQSYSEVIRAAVRQVVEPRFRLEPGNANVNFSVFAAPKPSFDWHPRNPYAGNGAVTGTAARS